MKVGHVSIKWNMIETFIVTSEEGRTFFFNLGKKRKCQIIETYNIKCEKESFVNLETRSGGTKDFTRE